MLQSLWIDWAPTAAPASRPSHGGTTVWTSTEVTARAMSPTNTGMDINGAPHIIRSRLLVVGSILHPQLSLRPLGRWTSFRLATINHSCTSSTTARYGSPLKLRSRASVANWMNPRFLPLLQTVPTPSTSLAKGLTVTSTTNTGTDPVGNRKATPWRT